MNDKWTIENSGEVWQLADDGLLKRATKRELRCPKGHRLDAFSTFAHLGVTVEVLCATCDSTYPLDI